MNTIKTVIFDLGRVLVSIDPIGPKFTRLMRAAGIPPAEAFDKFWFTAEVRQHMTGELSSRDFYHAAVERIGLDWSYEEFVEAWCDLFHPRPEMEKLFKEVASHRRIGLLSDTDPLHWEAVRKLLPWLDMVKKPTLSFEVGCLKPHPRMFAAAAADCGCAKEECLFIDDLLENVDGARYSGMPALVFSNADKLRGELRKLGII